MNSPLAIGGPLGGRFFDGFLPQHLQTAIAAGLELRQQGYRGRFAPSPTGELHRGNLRTALLSWLDARLQGGAWLLRLDDLDRPRNRLGASERIQAALHWLGLDWDGPPLLQSQRRGLYASVLSSLRRAGQLYPCGCSRRLLADISAPHGALAVYPGFCRQAGLGWGPLQAKLPSWRLRLTDCPIYWREDSGRRGCCDGAAEVGDVVLRRADGMVAYHLATAVDELCMGISSVVRGDDLWSSTGAQVAVMAVLGASPPQYWHVPLWRDSQGLRLSKRSAAEGLEGLRQKGADGPAVIGLLAASLGLVPAGSRLSAQELCQQLQLPALRAAVHKPLTPKARDLNPAEP